MRIENVAYAFVILNSAFCILNYLHLVPDEIPIGIPHQSADNQYVFYDEEFNEEPVRHLIRHLLGKSVTWSSSSTSTLQPVRHLLMKYHNEYIIFFQQTSSQKLF